MTTHVSSCRSGLTGPLRGSRLAVFVALAAATAAVAVAREGDEHFGIPQVKFINEQVAAGWADAKLKPSEAASDQEWCRRVHLDVIGRIPTVRELEDFVADSSPVKRANLVGRLEQTGGRYGLWTMCESGGMANATILERV